MHRLLERQLRQARAATGELDAERLVKLVEAAYEEQDRDRILSRRAIDLMSHELLEANRQINAKAERDVQQARRALAETTAEGARLAAALDCVSDGIALFDQLDRLVTCNPAFRRKLDRIADLLVKGVSFEEFLTAHIRSGRLDLGRQSSEEYHAERMRAFRSGASHERRLADGRWEKVQGQPLPDGGVLLTLSDITERKLAEEKQHAARLAAEAANIAKSQFLANMSHELRTPLNAIIGFSEVIAQSPFGPLGDARYALYLDDILKAGRHLLSVINDILDLAKVEAGHAELDEEECAPDALATAAIRMVGEAARRGQVAVEMSVAATLPRVRVDARRMLQVLVNLLSNAVKFTPPGGRVTLSASTAGAGLVLQVADTGIGMKSADIPRAFTAFTQIDGGLDRRHEGTGLGLPLAKSLIELHGGSIDLQSTPGVGTTATIRLPATRLVAPASRDRAAG